MPVYQFFVFFNCQTQEELVYYFSLKPELRQTLDYEIRLSLQQAQEYMHISRDAGQAELSQQAEELFTLYYQRYFQNVNPTQPR